MILHRYTTSLFAPAMAMFTTIMVVLVLIIDFVSRMGRFLMVREVHWFSFTARYYLIKFPFILPFLLPSAVMFAAMFTIVRLSKTNELTPIMVGGMSLRRICWPFFITAILIGALLAVLDEWVLPEYASELSILEDRLRGDRLTFRVLVPDPVGNHVFAQTYSRADKTLYTVLFFLRDDEGFQSCEIEAERAKWDDKAKVWTAYNGTIDPFDKGHHRLQEDATGVPRMVRETFGEEGYVVKIDLTPAELARRSSIVGQFLNLSEALRKVEQFPHIPIFKMQLYTKVSDLFLTVLLLLIGLPYVVSASRTRNLFVGMGLCMVLVVGFFLIQVVMFEFGNRNALQPVIAAFLPNVVFGTWGLIGFVRMKT